MRGSTDGQTAGSTGSAAAGRPGTYMEIFSYFQLFTGTPLKVHLRRNSLARQEF